MNENDIYTMLQGDDNLREAIRHREQKQPPMPADLNERLMKRLEDKKPSLAFCCRLPAHHRRCRCNADDARREE